MTTLDVQLWHVPDCPLVDRVRDQLRRCLDRTGITTTVHERSGGYPSPTLLINGVDVATGIAPGRDACCRLDLPTDAQILTALGMTP